MVALSKVKAANLKATETLPPGLVAVFAGTTAGIGELALKAFATHAPRPRIYFIGRSEEAGARLQTELKGLNADGEYLFVKAEMSLLKNVDEVCREIKKKETAINVLFMSQGTLRLGSNTSEGLPYLTALSYYSRMRLTVNLLPLIQRATSLRRVVSTFTGAKEGPLDPNDIPGKKVSFSKMRGHGSSLMTLSLEGLARRTPEVTFIHNFPGSVKTNLIRKDDGFMLQVIALVFKITPNRSYMDNGECGERHAYLCLTGGYPAAAGDLKTESDIEVVRGTDGKVGSGMYSVTSEGDCAPESSIEVLDKLRREGVVDKIWEHTEGEFKRITGSVSI